jgi:HAD superfamily hydrolase (TIGR01549 family)
VAERGALRQGLRDLALPRSRAVLAEYRRINESLWELYRGGGISQPHLAQERFRRLLAFLGAPVGQALRMSAAYLDALATRGDRLPGCRPVLRQLRARGLRLGVVTNGIDRVQRARIEAARLESLFAVVVTSEGCGFAKPDRRILEVALATLGLEPREALYVGDDVRTDGGAAAAAGVPFCWMDRGGHPPPARRPRLRLTHLRELLDVVDRGVRGRRSRPL